MFKLNRHEINEANADATMSYEIIYELLEEDTLTKMTSIGLGIKEWYCKPLLKVDSNSNLKQPQVEAYGRNQCSRRRPCLR
jgi:hypothetical protein